MMKIILKNELFLQLMQAPHFMGGEFLNESRE